MVTAVRMIRTLLPRTQRLILTLVIRRRMSQSNIHTEMYPLPRITTGVSTLLPKPHTADRILTIIMCPHVSNTAPTMHILRRSTLLAVNRHRMIKRQQTTDAVLSRVSIIIMRSAISVHRIINLIIVNATFLTVTRSSVTVSNVYTHMTPLPSVALSVNTLITKPHHDGNMIARYITPCPNMCLHPLHQAIIMMCLMFTINDKQLNKYLLLLATTHNKYSGNLRSTQHMMTAVRVNRTVLTQTKRLMKTLVIRSSVSQSNIHTEMYPLPRITTGVRTLLPKPCAADRILTIIMCPYVSNTAPTITILRRRTLLTLNRHRMIKRNRIATVATVTAAHVTIIMTILQTVVQTMRPNNSTHRCTISR